MDEALIVEVTYLTKGLLSTGMAGYVNAAPEYCKAAKLTRYTNR